MFSKPHEDKIKIFGDGRAKLTKTKRHFDSVSVFQCFFEITNYCTPTNILDRDIDRMTTNVQLTGKAQGIRCSPAEHLGEFYFKMHTQWK